MSARGMLAAASIAALLCVGRVYTHAQQAKNPLQSLQSLKEQNTMLLEQQKATLEKLDVLTKDAQQLRVFSKRS